MDAAHGRGIKGRVNATQKAEGEMTGKWGEGLEEENRKPAKVWEELKKERNITEIKKLRRREGEGKVREFI